MKMEYSFTCYGHENITAKHRTTLEFTKDTEMGLKGDCIVGVKADFSLDSLKDFIKRLDNNKVTIIIEIFHQEYDKKEYNEKNFNEKNIKNNYKNKKIIERINAEINPDFNSENGMVIRKSDFIDERTFAIKADKAACDLNRDLIEKLRNREQKIEVVISSYL